MNSQNSINDIVEYNHSINIKLNKICYPIFKNFEFDSFAYTRIYENSNRFILDTNQRWLEYYRNLHFIEENHGSGSIIHNLASLLTSQQEFHLAHFCIEEHTPSLATNTSKKIHDYLLICGILNSVSIYIHLKNFVEIYHFSSSSDCSKMIIDLCINKRYLFQRFLHYFREKIHSLDIEQGPYIKDATLSKIITQSIDSPTINIDNNIQDYIQQTRTTKFYLGSHNKFISRREAECLHYLSTGKTLKEIARILNISPRTVESHVNSLKEKTQSSTKSNLVNIAQENNINNHDFYLNFKDI